ncbi:hypothetical protein HDU76_002191 [Blyttiomyces sp. JEL0837]|nr:hypothetical protein HDU76_002191 [Blyttiomyces sp. JEL0837]
MRHMLEDSSEVLESNIVEFWKELQSMADSGSYETGKRLISAVGYLGRTAHENFLLHALIYLTDKMLGSSIEMKALAFNEIQMIAKENNRTTIDLIGPFLPEICNYMIDHSCIVEFIDEFSSAVNISQKEFATKVLDFVLPSLIIKRQSQIINTLASYVQEEPQDLCIQNMHNVLSSCYMLDMKANHCVEILKSLQQFGEQQISLSLLIRASGLNLIRLLALELGDEREDRRKKIITTLQMAMHTDYLIFPALQVFQTLVKTLDVQHVGPILSQIAAILSNNFKGFDSREKAKAGDIVHFFANDIREGLLQHLEKLARLLDTPEFAPINSILNSRRKLKSLGEQISNMVDGVSQENLAVSEYFLLDLKQMVIENAEELYRRLIVESRNTDVNTLVGVLLETCRKYSGAQSDIRRLCCELFGIVGAIDPSRLNIVPHQDAEINLDFFLSKRSARAYICNFIEKYLTPAFRATKTSKEQEYLSFAIQELLRFCSFSDVICENEKSTSDCKDPVANNAVPLQKRELMNLWSQFSKPTVEIVRPLLTARYSILPFQPALEDYPIYPNKPSFKSWLASWVGDLLAHTNGDIAKSVFSVCRDVAIENVNISIYILPCLILNILTMGNAEYQESILSEITAVLTSLASNFDSKDMEKNQLSSQVNFSACVRRKDVGKRKKAQARKIGRSLSSEEEDESDSLCHAVEVFLAKVPQELIAKASYNCRAYARSLMHFEQHIRAERMLKNDYEMQPLYYFLQKIYSHLDEPDGMEGITYLFLNPTLEQQILHHISGGRWTFAQSCYEMAVQLYPQSLQMHTGLIDCLKRLGYYGSIMFCITIPLLTDFLSETMLTHINGTISSHPEWARELASYGIEAAWRLGDWKSLDDFLHKPHETTFEVEVGKLLLDIKENNDEAFHFSLRQMRESIAAPLIAASMESYSRCYDWIVKLHMLQEIEVAVSFRWPQREETLKVNTGALLTMMESRLKVTVPSHRVREPILNLRRILFTDLNLRPSGCQETCLEAGSIWLETAKLLRKEGHFQPAFNAILHAAEMKATDVSIEKAKWLIGNGQSHKAIEELKMICRIYFGELDPGQVGAALVAPTNAPKLDKAKIHLLLAKAMEETGVGTSKTILTMLKQVTAEKPEWEKGYFYLGRYWNKLLENDLSTPADHSHLSQLRETTDEKIRLVCKLYANALLHGTKYVYQTLPRLLTLWLDYAANLSKKQAIDPKASAGFHAMNDLVSKLVNKLPTFGFLTALPQIISRICHINREAHALLETILVKVLKSYPHQVLWHLVSVSKSRYKIRANRCSAVFSKARSDPSSRHGSLGDLITEAQRLTDELLQLCNFPLSGKELTLTMSRDFMSLKRLAPCRMIVPTQQTLSITLPANGLMHDTHNPFTESPPTIAGFNEEIEIMNSLQKPRKISVLGSDGRDYIFLLKPKDDLRKDARLMEFNGLINRLLKKESEARRRNLHIRTYTVVPLNEECGIIDAKPHEVKALKDRKPAPVVDISPKIGLPKFPAVFHEWFLETFPEPTRWFGSRITYASTIAVMSMVGYVVGLGDRHGENILFDEKTGACVHVDLNCLFEKGKTFEKPEVVPFRLTHNMVDAFGIAGTEGVFRKSCEISMRILRNNRESLMAVLETFIYDPLCEWSKKSAASLSHKSLAKDQTGEIENEEAVKHLRTVDYKLKGIIKDGLPLGVEGQVKELIAEATDVRNLACMYIGWTPHF